MRRKVGNLNARLFLNDHDVGTVEVKGWDDAWGYGDFAPGEAFNRYAQHFRTWSKLLHADHGDHRLTDADREALRKVEYEIDKLHVKLFLVDAQEWRQVAQVNIDGPLIEWREEYTGEGVPSAA